MSNDFSNPNPYQATVPPPATMPVGEVPKPTSMVVFGILNLVFGAFGVLGIALGVLTLFLDLPKDDSPLQKLMEDPTYKVVNLVPQSIGVLLTFVLLASGVGLINGKLYGRRLAIIYAIAALLNVVLTGVVNVIFIALPAFGMASDLPAGEQQAGAILTGSIFMILPICMFIYPVLLLIFMKRAPVKNYFQIQ